MLAVTADLHLASHQAHGGQMRDGLNERGRICVAAFRASLRKAREAGAWYFAAGDIFNSWKPEPALVAAVQRAIQEECHDPSRVVLVAGNHDMQDSSPLSASTSLEPLQHHATLVRGPTWFHLPGVSVLCVSFTSDKPMADHLEEVLSLDLPEEVQYHRVLITHVGVTDSMSPSWLKGKKDAMDSGHLLALLCAAGFDGAFVGNYHAHQIWEAGPGNTPWIVQCGTMTPWNHSDEGEFPKVGGMALYTPGQLPTMVEIPGPRLLTLQPGEEMPKAGANQYFVRGVVAPDGAKAEGLEKASGLDLVPQVEEEKSKPLPKDVGSSEAAIVEYATDHGLSPEVLELAKSFWVKAS